MSFLGCLALAILPPRCRCTREGFARARLLDALAGGRRVPTESPLNGLGVSMSVSGNQVARAIRGFAATDRRPAKSAVLLLSGDIFCGKTPMSERSRRRRGKTEGVKALVHDVLASLGFRNPTDHVIRDVFLAIQRNARWRRRYDALCQDLGVDQVNRWGGRYVLYHVGKPRKMGRADAGADELIESYTVLDSRAMGPSRKDQQSGADTAHG